MFEGAKGAWARYVAWGDRRVLAERDRVAKLGPTGFLAYSGITAFFMAGLTGGAFLVYMWLDMLTMTALVAWIGFCTILTIFQYVVFFRAERSGA